MEIETLCFMFQYVIENGNIKISLVIKQPGTINVSFHMKGTALQIVCELSHPT